MARLLAAAALTLGACAGPAITTNPVTEVLQPVAQIVKPPGELLDTAVPPASVALVEPGNPDAAVCYNAAGAAWDREQAEDMLGLAEWAAKAP